MRNSLFLTLFTPPGDSLFIGLRQRLFLDRIWGMCLRTSTRNLAQGDLFDTPTEGFVEILIQIRMKTSHGMTQN